MSAILEFGEDELLSSPGCSPHLWREKSDGIGGRILVVCHDLDAILEKSIFSAFNSRSPAIHLSAVRFMAIATVLSDVLLPFVYNIINAPGGLDKIIADALLSEENSLCNYATILLAHIGSNRYYTDLIVRTEIPITIIKRLNLAYTNFCNELKNHNIQQKEVNLSDEISIQNNIINDQIFNSNIQHPSHTPNNHNEIESLPLVFALNPAPLTLEDHKLRYW